MEQFVAAIPSIISAILIGVLAWFGKALVGFRKEHIQLIESQSEIREMSAKLDELLEEHAALMECNRNQNKSDIVEIYEHAVQCGYITPMELDSMNRLADSYFKLGGNHYVHAIVKRSNNELAIVGEPIPE